MALRRVASVEWLAMSMPARMYRSSSSSSDRPPAAHVICNNIAMIRFGNVTELWQCWRSTCLIPTFFRWNARDCTMPAANAKSAYDLHRANYGLNTSASAANAEISRSVLTCSETDSRVGLGPPLRLLLYERQELLFVDLGIVCICPADLRPCVAVIDNVSHK